MGRLWDSNLQLPDFMGSGRRNNTEDEIAAFRDLQVFAIAQR